MKKKAIILDLDNTIYPVSSIGNDLFHPLFKLIEETGEYSGDLEKIKQEMMRRPFQKVAEQCGFSDRVKTEGTSILEELTYEKEINAFEDYEAVKALPCKKFLVTTGFTKMQESKVKQLGLRQDFEEVHVVDPQLSNKTKKDIFKEIIERHQLDKQDVLVIGDDPESEIKAAKELGVDAVLYDKLNFNPDVTHLQRITDFRQLKDIV